MSCRGFRGITPDVHERDATTRSSGTRAATIVVILVGVLLLIYLLTR
jgi:hypothetical protein